MIKTTSVERTSKYPITKEQLEALILREIDPSMADGVAPNVTVKFEYDISGGTQVDDYDDRYGGTTWAPYKFGGLTVTVTEKS